MGATRSRRRVDSRQLELDLTRSASVEIPMDDFEASPENDVGFVLDPEQADAVYLLAHARVGVITGGPGRGKTKSLQAALPYIGRSVALCAPSGKAARRMAELTGYPASTVHRLLGLQPNSESCIHHRGNPLPFECVIVDEASTLDIFLLGRLLDACNVAQTRVFFVGDVDQLPSVGPGQILFDLIDSGVLPVVRLMTMHRNVAESWVYRMAPEILEGRIDLSQCEDFVHIEADEDVVEQVVAFAQKLVGTVGRDEVQVVAPTNVGECGTSVLNVELQKALNVAAMAGPSFGAGKARIYVDDAVVVVANDYERATFNGETGRVVSIGVHTDEVVVDLVDRLVTYTKAAAAENLRLAYALSVHKMQGSEVGWIVLAMHDSHGPMLSRKLLYTAVTRAKQGVIIVGQRSAVLRAVSVMDVTVRQTMLSERLVKLWNAYVGG